MYLETKQTTTETGASSFVLLCCHLRELLKSLLWWHFGLKYLCASLMVGEFSKGSVRHRGQVASTAAVCLLPVKIQSRSWSSLFGAFTFGVFVTILAGFWWLLSLDN